MTPSWRNAVCSDVCYSPHGVAEVLSCGLNLWSEFFCCNCWVRLVACS